MIFNKVALKMAWQKIKNLDDFSIFTPQQLGLTRIYNIFAVIVNLFLFYFFLNSFIKYLFFFFIIFYSYRFFLLERYIKKHIF